MSIIYGSLPFNSDLPICILKLSLVSTTDESFTNNEWLELKTCVENNLILYNSLTITLLVPDSFTKLSLLLNCKTNLSSTVLS